uniref:Band 7 domain-containing protein n=1 Tax=Triticum urartu TaxID=4572 RepID=A0A8R7R383_TRIUA
MIVDPYRASYGVENPIFAVIQLAQTTMRSELGKITLDKTFEERDTLNEKIVRSINEASTDWGLKCLRYEIRDISPPPGVKNAMEMQAEAERRKRAQILQSEGAAEGERMEALVAPTTMDGAAAVIFMWIWCHLPIFPNGVQQSGSDLNARSEVGSRLVGGVPESS